MGDGAGTANRRYAVAAAGSRWRVMGAELGRGTGEAAALLGNETAAAGTELDWEKIWAPNREALIPDVRVQVRRRGRRSNREKESEGIRGFPG